MNSKLCDSWGIHWFRRDLRLAGNSAFRWSWKKHQGRVLGLFCFDPKFLSRPDFSPDRFGFFLKSLESLRDELREAGGDLLVLDHGPQEAFKKLLSTLDRSSVHHPSTLSFNRDYEPFARNRDQWAVDFFSKQTQIQTHSERDHLLIEPEEIIYEGSKKDQYYSVYTPFARRWFAKLSEYEIQDRLNSQKEGLKYLELRKNKKKIPPFLNLTWAQLFKKESPPADCLNLYLEKILKELRVPMPEAGSLAAFNRLEQFRDRIGDYKEKRDFPAVLGTSKLSIYLKNGSVTVSQIMAHLGLGAEDFKAKTGSTQFVKELAWREFYYHILWHRPDIEHQAFLPQFQNLKWENREDYFQAWKEGRTGYPIVDAGMRELATTGWMHNRVRMIVASFLTKDLLIDWRWGEKYFMERLLDGDLAPNNGGWQWAASTGCDPQPYFRIFNPELQSRKFDPEGKYIREFVPELRSIRDTDALHAPSDSARPASYPKPTVEHSLQRVKALALFKSATNSFSK